MCKPRRLLLCDICRQFLIKLYNMKFSNYALVTGAGSGLGKEIALKLGERGIPTVITGRTGSKLQVLCNENPNYPFLPITINVGHISAVENAFQKANQWATRPKYVINCAGEGVFGEVGSFSKEDIDKVLEANLIGTILVSQKAFLEMKELDGFIVNVMSTSSNIGRANESIYCASKWGAKGFTEALRVEAAKTKVKVISVFPGGMNTHFWHAGLFLKPDATKFMKPQEVAEVIVNNLLDRNSLYITEQVINRI